MSGRAKQGGCQFGDKSIRTAIKEIFCEISSVDQELHIFPLNLDIWLWQRLVRVLPIHSILSINFPLYLSGRLDLSSLYLTCHYPDADVTTIVSSNKLESWSDNSVSFFTTSPRGAHYCLYIHWLTDWIENWNSSQSETQFYASGSGFEFSNTNMRERAGPVRQKIWISNAENCHPFSFIINWALANWGDFVGPFEDGNFCWIRVIR